jgi:hypothetical protein
MRDIRKLAGRLVNAFSTRMFHAGKFVYQAVWPLDSVEPKRILFIFGCQRSGTTMMQEIFDRDINSKVYGEFSAITRTRGKAHNIRLRPLEEVKAIFDRDRVGFIVAKPLAETQNARKLLEYFPQAKAVFIYRHYRAVASSNLKLFGQTNGINNLRPIVNGDGSNWRAEGVTPETRALVMGRFHESMNPYDAAALFWYVRNRFFFELALDQHPSVKLLKYEDLVRDPEGTIADVYNFAGARFSRTGTKLVHGHSVAKGKDVDLSPSIVALCEELLARLNRTHAATPAMELLNGRERWAWQA